MARQMLFLLAVLTGIMLCFSGCATTGPSYQDEEPVEDVSDIDQLLGLGEEKPAADDRINEDDVLKLLGVSDEEPLQSNRESQLQAELEQLQAKDSDLNLKQGDLNQKISQQQGVLSNAGASAEKTGFGSKRETFASRYQRAYQSYLQRGYQNAIQLFEALLKENPKHSLSDNCQYWVGESYYGLGKYMQALIAFQKVFTFSQSNKDADAQLKIGICHLQLKDNEKAKQELQKLISNYPNSQYVAVARRYLESLN